MKVSKTDLKSFTVENIKIDERWLDLYVPNNEKKKTR